MTNYSFNLIDRAWIWGVWRDGARRELIGLRTALTRAGELREIHGDTPPETAALHRLLLTVLYRIYNAQEEWGKVWAAGRFDPERIEGYLARVHSRFDLFDRETPFLQAGEGSEAWGKFKLISISNLAPHFASGNDAVLFDHRVQDSGIGGDAEADCGTTLKADMAARTLLAQQAFGFGGLNDPGAANVSEKAFSNAPCARGAIFLLEGETLFETLMLNFFPLELEENHRLRHRHEDRPAWEMDHPFIDDPRRPYGYLDYATWLNRKVLLLAEGDPEEPVVRRMRYYVGMKRMNGNPLNPLMSLRPDPNAGKKAKGSDEEESSHLPQTFREGRALWRDSLALYGWLLEREHIPPRALEWVSRELPGEGLIESGRDLFFAVYGICSKSGQDKMYSYRAERYPLPRAYLQEAGLEAAKQLKLALEHAEAAARSLQAGGGLGVFAAEVLGIAEEDRGKESNRERIRSLARSTGAERYYWSRLEAHFVRLVEDLPVCPEEAIEAWNRAVEHLARRSFEEAVKVIGGSKALRAYGIAANQFEYDLWAGFHPEEAAARKNKGKAARQSETGTPSSD